MSKKHVVAKRDIFFEGERDGTVDKMYTKDNFYEILRKKIDGYGSESITISTDKIGHKHMLLVNSNYCSQNFEIPKECKHQ